MSLPRIEPSVMVEVHYWPTSGRVEIQSSSAGADPVILALVKALWATLAGTMGVEK